jgi:hypothetical protein
VILASLSIERPGAKLHLTIRQFRERSGSRIRDSLVRRSRNLRRSRNMTPPSGGEQSERKKVTPPVIDVVRHCRAAPMPPSAENASVNAVKQP